MLINRIFENRKLALLVIFLFTAGAYLNAFQNEFVVDDHLFIVNWPLIRDLGNWPQFFGSHNQPAGEEGVYSPLKTVLHALNRNAFGLNPFGYHLLALCINFAGILYVYRISAFLTRNTVVAFLGALFFALHPTHVEAVGNMTGSIDNTGIVYLFISFYHYIYFLEKKYQKKKNYLISFIFAVLAVFTHELAITLPILFSFYLFLYYRYQMRWGTMAKIVAPYYALVAVYVVLKGMVLGSIARGGYLMDSAYLTMLVVIKALANYVLIMLFPFKLIANHQISKGIYSVDAQYFDKVAVLSQSIFDVQVLCSVALTSAVIYAAFKLYRRDPLITFCIGWFYICLLPVLNIIPTGTYFTERYLYPGSMGFCLMLAYVMVNLYAYKKTKHVKAKNVLIILIIAVVCAFYSVRTVLRNADFKDELTFYKAEVKGNPDHPIMNRDLGVTYLNVNDPHSALPYLMKAVELLPEDEDAYFALAEAYGDLRNFTMAIKNYEKAIELKQDFAESYYNLAGIYAYLARPDLSEEYFDKAIRFYKMQGQITQAKKAAQEYNRYMAGIK